MIVLPPGEVKNSTSLGGAVVGVLYITSTKFGAYLISLAPCSYNAIGREGLEILQRYAFKDCNLAFMMLLK